MNPIELSPNHFHDLAAEVVKLATEYLSTLQERRVFPSTSGAETIH